MPNLYLNMGHYHATDSNTIYRHSYIKCVCLDCPVISCLTILSYFYFLNSIYNAYIAESPLCRVVITITVLGAIQNCQHIHLQTNQLYGRGHESMIIVCNV